MFVITEVDCINHGVGREDVIDWKMIWGLPLEWQLWDSIQKFYPRCLSKFLWTLLTVSVFCQWEQEDIDAGSQRLWHCLKTSTASDQSGCLPFSPSDIKISLYRCLPWQNRIYITVCVLQHQQQALSHQCQSEVQRLTTTFRVACSLPGPFDFFTSHRPSSTSIRMMALSRLSLAFISNV